MGDAEPAVGERERLGGSPPGKAALAVALEQ